MLSKKIIIKYMEEQKMGIFGTKNTKFGFGGRDDDFDDYVEDNGFEDEDEEEVAAVEAPAAPAPKPDDIQLLEEIRDLLAKETVNQ